MTDINWLHAVQHYGNRLADMWPGKLAVGTGFSALLSLLGVDHVIFGIMLAALTGEMLSRIAVGCKRGRSLCRGLQRGLVRYTCYGLFLLMAVGVDISLRRALGFSLPVTDIFMLYLILTDCASIIGHLTWLGVNVPRPLRVLVMGSRERMEETLESVVDDPSAPGQRGKE